MEKSLKRDDLDVLIRLAPGMLLFILISGSLEGRFMPQQERMLI